MFQKKKLYTIYWFFVLIVSWFQASVEAKGQVDILINKYASMQVSLYKIYKSSLASILWIFT